MTPVLLLSDKPAGSEPPEMDHVYGAVPPPAVNVPEYDAPMVPPGIVVVVMVSEPIFQGLGIAVISGAVIATALTLVAIPLLYYEMKR